MPKLTVFTPTFNRAFCLGQLYESLVAQTCPDFIWLIIDDGSTDGTKALVDSWIAADKIRIQYIFQQNQGMHGGHNTAYANITTELNVCIDSDDYMPDTAVEFILRKWEKEGTPELAGIIGLDAFKDGSIVGTAMPENLKQATLTDLYLKYGVKGDKKLVLRTEIVRRFPPYPIFESERFVPLGILYLMIDQEYDCLCANEVYCIVEYLDDGSSRNILKQYRRHPNGFGYSRLVEMKYSKSLKYTFTRAMHLVSSQIFAGKYSFFKNNPSKFVTLLALPFGLGLHAYILMKTRK